MSGLGTAVRSVAASLRDVTTSALGVMAPLRSKKGTYGTQRAESRDLDDERRRAYPRD